MKISGKYTIDAPREQVWDALNDLEVLARVVPGCERLEQTGDNQFEGTMKIGIQTIKGTYNGRIRLEDIQPPQHYKLSAHGQSANGIVDGTGTVDLAEQDGKTVLTYSGAVSVAGTLASVGQRLIEGASKQLINQSLKALADQIRQRAAGEAPADAAPAEAAPPAQPAGASARQPTPAASMIGQAATAAATAAPPAASATNGQPGSTPAGPPRRSVIVPEDEQLKPEAVALGMLHDFYAERPWLPWVIVAFLTGYILGRSRSSW